MGTGFGSLALAALPLLQTHGATPPVVLDPLNPFSPRAPRFPARARSVIFLFLVGGPSPVDTFDYKPALQKLNGKPVPDSIRKAVEATRFANVFHGCKDELMASPFSFRQYGESGMWVSELFPQVARHVDDHCFLHSVQADSNNHAPASYQFHTGDIRPGKASLGSWITYGLGTENQDLPGYVMLFDAGPLGGAVNYSNGFLPAAFQPTRLRDVGTPVLDLLPPPDFARGQRASLDLIRELNLRHRESRPGFTDLEARIASYELAYRMQSAALEVGEVEREPEFLRRSYGLEHPETRTQSFGRKCLMARRLVERGVRFVQVYDIAGTGRPRRIDQKPCSAGPLDRSADRRAAGRPQATRTSGRDPGHLRQRVWPDAHDARRAGAGNTMPPASRCSSREAASVPEFASGPPMT